VTLSKNAEHEHITTSNLTLTPKVLRKDRKDIPTS
jgi:hypothetical protein